MAEVLTNVDIDEVFKRGGELCKIFEGVTCRENFSVSQFKKGIEYLCNLNEKKKMKETIYW